jgi:peroxiredoxin family protein
MPNYTIRTNRGMSAMDYIKLGGAAIGATVLVFFGWKAYKAIQTRASQNKELKDYSKEINKNNISFSQSEFVTMADRIDQALNSTWDDDEQTVYDILSRLKSKDDWNLLIKTFGVRKRWAAIGRIEGTLIDWFQDAFSSSELTKVKTILSKIGVTF